MKVSIKDVLSVKVQGKTYWDDDNANPYKAVRITIDVKCVRVPSYTVKSTQVVITTKCDWGSCKKYDVSTAAARILCDTFGWDPYKFTMSKPWREHVVTVKGYSDIEYCEFK